MDNNFPSQEELYHMVQQQQQTLLEIRAEFSSRKSIKRKKRSGRKSNYYK
jgi:hypothetical protein